MSGMSLLVTGSIGIDTVSTPYGAAENVLGGSAVYFAFAASQYVPVRLVGVVGEDFPEEFLEMLASRPIDLAGMERRRGSKTFRWHGRFERDMNEADTMQVQLNVLSERGPTVPAAFLDSSVVFLANTHPTLQRQLLGQLHGPRLVFCDTMNLWIEVERESLLETLRLVGGVILNDGEARLLTGQNNLVVAGEEILRLGPRYVIIKKGEHGSLLFSREGITAVPGYPTQWVVDPTGAGDSFAGGFLGYLASAVELDGAALRMALVHGTVAASFVIEGFSLDRVINLTREEIDRRVERFVGMLNIVGNADRDGALPVSWDSR
jgi:sugar/nucleoside kinase (ribokinase family)